MGGCRSISAPADRGRRRAWRRHLGRVGGAAGRSDPLGHRAAAPRAAPPGPSAPRRLTGLLPPRRHPPTRPLPAGSAPTPPSAPRREWPSCTAGWPGTARRCTGRWPTGCSPTAPTSPARSSITSHGRRTSRAACGTGHRGCSCRRSAARLKAPAGNVSTSTTPKPRPCPKPACAGTVRKSRSPNGSTGAGAASREHRDLFSAYLGLHVRTGADGLDRLDLEAANHGWLHRQDIDGCRGPAAAPSTGEAADTRPRGGQWRASRPGVKPKPRCDRAGRHEIPPPTGLRRCPHEQRDSRSAGGIPAHSVPGGRQAP